MEGRISSLGVPLDDLPAGLVSRLVTIPVALFLRNSGHLVLYAQAGADAAMLRRADLAGRFWIAAGDVPVVRAMLPQALGRALAERPDDPVVGYREGYGLLIETIEQIFVPGCDPDESDIRLIEGAMDVLVDRHLADPTAAETSVTVLRRRHDWAYDALNTCLLSIVLGTALGIDRPELGNIARGAFFHDLGMTQLPASLTEHAGPLLARQLARIREHPKIGVTLLREALGFVPAYAAIVRDHHERIDGSGYPSGLAGDALSLAAQVVGIADTWEAMTARRPHRAPADFAAAEQRLLDPAAGFDVRLTTRFVAVVARR